MQSIIYEARFVSLATKHDATEMVDAYLKDFYSSMDTGLHALTTLYLQHKAGESALHVDNRTLEAACADYELQLDEIRADECERCEDYEYDLCEVNRGLTKACQENTDLKKGVRDLEKRLRDLEAKNEFLEARYEGLWASLQKVK